MSAVSTNFAPNGPRRAEARREDVAAIDLAPRLREITGLEEEWIGAESRDANPPAACHEVLARCLCPPGASPQDMLDTVRKMTYPERDWLLLELRRRTFGPRMRAQVRCPNCGCMAEAEFSSGELPLEPGAAWARTAVRLPSGAVAVLGPLTAGDHEEFAGLHGLEEAEQAATALARALVSLEARDGPFSPLDIEFLAPDDVAALQASLEQMSPEGVDINLNCQECARPMVAPLDMCAFFFAELREHGRTLLDDVHTLARTYHWSEPEILALPLGRRLAYLSRIEAESDGALLGGAQEGR